ncbi:hypothetical protein ElyMa_003674000 [Elysia marginata]|uniref:Uncharacterized protein n=1 Tax=Elysia marginata TaxID=1093978 RepID=A0AAV4EY15_9GAST|nr:hypothetical protein ElyMa_003674000 [Elysia marginata]
MNTSNGPSKDDLFKSLALPLPPSSQQTMIGEQQSLFHSVSHAQPLALTSASVSSATSTALPATGHKNPHMTSPPAGMLGGGFFNIAGADAADSACSMAGPSIPAPHRHTQMPLDRSAPHPMLSCPRSSTDFNTCKFNGCTAHAPV